MKVEARIPLKLDSKTYKITLIYNTFEHASFDKFLVGSIVKNSESKIAAKKYIDEITGKGSLNELFKKEYEKISNFSKVQIDRLLQDSLYPQTVVDDRHSFKYFPSLDCSIFKGKAYPGNLENNQSVLQDEIMPKNEKCSFEKITLSPSGENDATTNNYDCILDDVDGFIEVNIANNSYFPIPNYEFEKCCVVENIDLNNFLINGTISTKFSNNRYYLLRETVINDRFNNNCHFFNEKGNLCIAEKNHINEIEISKFNNLYLYKETNYPYSKNIQGMCDKALQYFDKLVLYRSINENLLCKLLSNSSSSVAVKFINNIAPYKKSKPIIDIAFSMAKEGFTQDWSYLVVTYMRDFCGKSDIELMYRINPNLNYSDEELSFISDEILTEQDKNRKREYIDEGNNLLYEINVMIGEITNSAVRERMKKLPTKDSVYNDFKNFLNNNVGHNKKDCRSFSRPELTKYYNELKSAYTNWYLNILERCEKNEAKKSDNL